MKDLDSMSHTAITGLQYLLERSLEAQSVSTCYSVYDRRYAKQTFHELHWNSAYSKTSAIAWRCMKFDSWAKFLLYQTASNIHQPTLLLSTIGSTEYLHRVVVSYGSKVK